MWALIITLVILGLLLIGAEILIIPGFGVAGILGIASFIASSYMAFNTYGAIAGFAVIAVNVVLVVVFIVISLRSKTWKKVSLNTNIESKVDEAAESKGLSIGMKGITITRLAPGGNARFGDVTVEVFSRSSLIESGCEVEISELGDNKIFVKTV